MSDPELLTRTLRVLRHCRSIAAFESVILFTVIDPADSIKIEGLKIIQIPDCTERSQWQILNGRTIPAILEKYYRTLCVHEDGFPLKASMWSNDFLDYDYVGAPWFNNSLVGSGGCCLTSGMLMGLMTMLPWYNGQTNVDEWVCLTHRERLMQNGIRFAPTDLAAKFCTETTHQEFPSFAYHGRSHAMEKHRLAWEQLEQLEKDSGW